MTTNSVAVPTSKPSQARWQFPGWLGILLVLLIAGEIAMRNPLVIARLPAPEPTFWHAENVEAKLDYLHHEMEADQTIQAGGFMHQFSGDDWRLKLISFLDNFRCIRSRIIYGDQALFVRRALFEQLGGFPNRPILEDVALCERLIAVTTPLLLSPSVVTDARKFLKMGVWRSFLRVLLIILHVEFRLPVLPRAFFQDVR